MERAPFYQPLDTDSHEIRLLRILPVRDDTEIVDCLLETVSLDASPKYFGLSYEWAKYPPEQPHPKVLVNSQEIPVKANLALAISRLRELGDDTPFWIDALCINQNDDIERAQQVRIMARIYENSSAVYSWLGLAEGNSDKGIEFVEEFNRTFPVRPSREIARAMLKWAKEKLLDLSYQGRWDGLNQICERSYWTRVWIIQEIVVTEKRQGVRLLCGSKQVPLELFHLLVFLAGDARLSATLSDHKEPWFALSHKLSHASREISAIIRHAGAWGEKKLDEQALGLRRLLCDHTRSQSSDLRDKVYALLGVSLAYQGLELEINYSMSVSRVFLNTAQYIIRGSKSMGILIDPKTYSLELSGLPTWVPDWSAPQEGPAMISSLTLDFDACGSTPANTIFSSDGTRLTAVKSIIVGIVTELNDGEWWGPNLENVPKGLDDYQLAIGELCRWLNFARWSIQRLKSDPTDHDNETFFLSPNELARAVYNTVLYTHAHDTYQRLSFEKFHVLCNYLCELVPEETQVPDLSKEDLLELVLALRESRKLCKIQLSRPLPVKYPYIDPRGESGSEDASEEESEDEFENASICGSDCSVCFPNNASGNASVTGSGRSMESDPERDSESSSEVGGRQCWTTTLGMCHPKRAKINDVAVVVRGCEHPILVRKKENGYELVCELYVHGIMFGEAMGRYPEMDIEFI